VDRGPPGGHGIRAINLLVTLFLVAEIVHLEKATD
jgi:hypothetical protein